MRPGNLTAMWAADAVKSLLKTDALRRPGVISASLRRRESRAHPARLDTSGPKAVLGPWPVAERGRLLREAMDSADLLGFRAPPGL